MTTFLLLHGSWHAAWNWHRVVPLLEAAGHRAIALDLPGHGLDATPPHRVTLDRCVDRVLDALDEPAVLVAHSRNGIVISQAAERAPDRVTGLVYLAAYLVPHGRSMMDYAILDDASLCARHLDPPVPPRRAARLTRLFRGRVARWLGARLLPRRLQTHMLARPIFRDALYHDCPDEITALATALLEPEPNWPGFTPLALSPARYGRVPKVYLECTDDRAVTLALQRRMQADTRCDAVISLPGGHSPFFARPARLVEALVESLAIVSAARSTDPRPGSAAGRSAARCRAA
jgi:pimeloyl-ACP methyl ester carboxylesterase